MDCCSHSLSHYSKPSPAQCSPSLGLRANLSFDLSGDRRPSRSLSARPNRAASVAVACEFGGLNAPLEPKSPAGRRLSRVLLNERECFHGAAKEQLELLASEREGALARMGLSLGSTEACLHRRIAELKEHECQTAVEDVMYMLIFYKFSDIRVHMVPRLSKCIYNSRLEIWPSKDWELESIHSFEVLEMIKEHLTTVVGWKADSNVTDNWATTEIQRLQICRIYAASILYGYFLKSASLRHHLEVRFANANYDLGVKTGASLPLWSYGLKNIAFDHISNTQSTSVGPVSCSQVKKQEKLRCYVMGFDPEILQMCAMPRSKEALNLIEKHSCALFWDENMGLLEADEVISTSLASLKRFVLEAVAFGSFLWDAEEYVDTVYKLEDY
ncbi:hypothetical protein RJ639_039746 [Escallonia herrerae]|uniref:UV-B-induced protein At3g17800, chloroplastic n=1 Tax=Escallonia herrerae TaxID=1293975 RepID=A0AA89B9T9_9ASTE|nr:hypothetical protein RJ639_039746 [Escallonia herrerae]